MPEFFWLAVCAGYWLWAAKGRRSTFLQGLLHGFFLGALCFGILPPVMEMPLFYAAAVCSVCGTAAGVWLEEKWGERNSILTALLFTALILLWCGKIGGSLQYLCCIAFFGGMGLYAACCGILPEDGAMRDRLRPAVGGCAGFLISAAIFAQIGIF